MIPALSEDNKLLQFQTGTDSCSNPVYFSISAAQVVSILLIVFLTYTNTKGIKGGKWIQNIFTTTKLLSLFGLIIAGFIAFKPEIWQRGYDFEQNDIYLRIIES